MDFFCQDVFGGFVGGRRFKIKKRHERIYDNGIL